MGRARRTHIADRTSALLRDAGHKCEGKSRFAADKLQGLGHAIGSGRDAERDRVAPTVDQPMRATG